ncbi:XRE family transcriptional regulator [Macrococcus hajekii]|uniref:XRE family transcriptional regulator n=1 Tax=Macrococcus hajekii TaxID=198482 RepID=A0A4R6BI11_9STAP|nr:XRE family transcriptional regulator [Macrococcus hajekii]TDM01175.1 XRE family transcriptional regulator [Macrococcus hajekii]GGB11935.1 DNA-binding protein [Macrococcus hajekii]
MSIGQKIREIRLMQKLTLKEIASQTDLSIPFLSQLERNKCNATMGSLRKIADVLNVHPSAFFDYNEAEQPAAQNNNLFTYYDLSQQVAGAFKPLKVSIEPNEQISKPIAHKGAEFVYCLSGTLTVVVADENYHLQPQQSLMYEATKPHYWYNHSDDTVTFLVVNEN